MKLRFVNSKIHILLMKKLKKKMINNNNNRHLNYTLNNINKENTILINLKVKLILFII